MLSEPTNYIKLHKCLALKVCVTELKFELHLLLWRKIWAQNSYWVENSCVPTIVHVYGEKLIGKRKHVFKKKINTFHHWLFLFGSQWQFSPLVLRTCGDALKVISDEKSMHLFFEQTKTLKWKYPVLPYKRLTCIALTVQSSSISPYDFRSSVTRASDHIGGSLLSFVSD